MTHYKKYILILLILSFITSMHDVKPNYNPSPPGSHKADKLVDKIGGLLVFGVTFSTLGIITLFSLYNTIQHWDYKNFTSPLTMATVKLMNANQQNLDSYTGTVKFLSNNGERTVSILINAGIPNFNNIPQKKEFYKHLGATLLFGAVLTGCTFIFKTMDSINKKNS